MPPDASGHHPDLLVFLRRMEFMGGTTSARVGYGTPRRRAGTKGRQNLRLTAPHRSQMKAG